MANTYHDEKGYLRDSYGRLIHRQIAYQQIYCKNREKYSKPFGEYVVHHIDENKKNNDVSNLLIMFPEDHKKIHQIGQPLKELEEEPEEKFTKKKTEEPKKKEVSKSLTVSIMLALTIILGAFLLAYFLEVSEEPIEKSEPISISTSSTEITIKNTLQKTISMEITYRIYSKWYGRDTTETKIFDVGAYQTKTFLVWGNNGCKITGCPNNVEIIESTRVK